MTDPPGSLPPSPEPSGVPDGSELAAPVAGPSSEAPRQPRSSRPGGKRPGSFARELPVLVVIAVGLALLIKTFLLQAFYIPSGSMERTLLIGDRVMVNKLVYHLRSIHRGEIIVFNTKGTNFASLEPTTTTPATNVLSRGVRDVQCFLGLGCPGETDFIKRVIGIPGDRVACCDSQGRVTVNGAPLGESFLYQDDHQPICAGATPAGPPSSNCPAGSPPVVVQPGDLFVMGDHRSASADSRVAGQLPEKKVVGRAFLRIWPLSRIGFLNVPASFHRVPAAPSTGVAAGLGVLPVALLLRPRRRTRRRPAPE